MGVSTSSANLFRPDSQQRALLACVAASIALHAAVLFAFPELRRSAPALPLAMPATLVSSAAQPEPAAAERPVITEPPRRKSRPRPVARPDPQPEVARAVPTPVPETEPVAPAPEPPAREVVQAPAAAPSPPGPIQTETPRPSAQVWDGQTLQQYRLGLMAFAKQFKRYPVQAMERGWEGRVEIRITVRP